MVSEDELRYERDELRRMLIALICQLGDEVRVPFESYKSASTLVLRIEPDNQRQEYVLTTQ